MANTSIKAAFERMWQHVVAALNNKADAAATTEALATKITSPLEAAVGQSIIVKVIDDNGVPVEWECADISVDGATFTEHIENANLHITQAEKELLVSVFLDAHTHDNKTVLDAIASSVNIYTTTEAPKTAEDGSIWLNMANEGDAPSIYVRRDGMWEMSSDAKAQVQPDWNETDGTKASYILHKPFGYKDDIYANAHLDFELSRNNVYKGNATIDDINTGDEYTIIWDNTAYDLTAKQVTYTTENSTFTFDNVLGNISILIKHQGSSDAVEDSGEPFVFVPIYGILTKSTLATHSIVIKQKNNNIIKIDPKFLPEEALKSPVQSNWDETNEESPAFIHNKPEIPNIKNLATTEYVDEQIAAIEIPDMPNTENLATKEYVNDQIAAIEFPEIPEGVATEQYVNDQIAAIEFPEVKEQIQADWNQIDGTQADYIRNKPFGYREDLYANSSLEFTALNNKAIRLGAISYQELDTNVIEDNKQYTIIWDNTAYYLYPQYVTIDFSETATAQAKVIGNGQIAVEALGINTVEDTGEPFAFIANLGFYTRSTAAAHSVVVKETDNIVKIDPKFLPDEALSAVNVSNVYDAESIDAMSGKAVAEALQTINMPNLEGLATEEYVNTAIQNIEFPNNGEINVQSDWNETNYNSDAFIKNKPFGLQEDFLNNNAKRFSLSNNSIYTSSASNTMTAWETGDNITVIWDGTEYNLTAKEMAIKSNSSGNTIVMLAGLGNATLCARGENATTTLSNTGEPFCIAFNKIYTNSTAETHSVIIRKPDNFTKLSTDLIEGLSAVATSGNYNDLSNKPDFATVNDIANAISQIEIPSVEGLASETYVNQQISAIEIPEVAQADWDETNPNSPAYIKNKPVISGDGGASVQANWGQTDETAADFIKNKPFGEYKGLVDILQYTTYDGFGLNSDYGVYAYPWHYTYDLIVGETYMVRWDDVDYTCVAQDAGALMNGAVAIGNLSNFGLSGNNEPFIIAVISGDGVIYASLTDTEAGNAHSVGIAKKDILVKKIDQKYLSTSWNDLSDKPFYEYEGQVEILPLKTYENFALDSTYQSYMTGEESNYLLSVGESYKVLWDGIEYECIAQDTSSVMAGTACIGNVAAWGFSGNNEPFIIMTLSANNWSTYVSLTDTEDGGSHSVQITQKKMLTKQIDKKFIPIPFFGKEDGIVLDCTFQDTKYDSDEDGIDDTWYGEAIIEDSSDATLVAGEIYTVMWNGVEYECECMEVEGLPAVGNTIVIGGENNGIPFAIARDVSGNVLGAAGWIAIPIEPKDDGIYHCIISGNSIKKVDLQYLYQPNWNENNRNSGSYIANKPFGEITAGTVIVPKQNVNLTIDFANNGELWASIVPNMGLSDYIVEGKNYNINFDGRYYMGVGVAQDDMGIGVTYQSDSTRIAIADNYQGTGLSIIVFNQTGQHTVSVTCAEDIITKIDPKYLPDNIGGGSSLPEVDTSNNGQVMTVVNGVWTAQTPASGLPEVSTSDAGKFLRVDSNGQWILETIPNATEVSF